MSSCEVRDLPIEVGWRLANDGKPLRDLVSLRGAGPSQTRVTFGAVKRHEETDGSLSSNGDRLKATRLAHRNAIDIQKRTEQLIPELTTAM